MNIKFKSLKLQYFIIFFCTIILAGGIIFYYLMAISGLEDILRKYLWTFYNLWTVGLVVGSIVAVPLYLLLFMILKLFVKEYELYFNIKNIVIKAKNLNKTIYYYEIENIVIHNVGNYAKLIIATDTIKYKFNIGLGNLNLIFWKVNTFKIFDSFNEVDIIFTKNNFVKIMDNKKGIIKYKGHT